MQSAIVHSLMPLITAVRAAFLGLILTLLASAGFAQDATQPSDTASAPLQALLQSHRAVIEKSSRTTIGPVIDAIAASDLPGADVFLDLWQNKEIYQIKETGIFVTTRAGEGKALIALDIETGAEIATLTKSDLDQLKPNSGIRAMIAAALVNFQLRNPDPAIRRAALDALARDGNADHLTPLRAAIAGETDPAIKTAMSRLERLLTIRFDADETARVEAIQSFKGDLGVDFRAAINPLVVTKRIASADQPGDDINIAARLKPGSVALSESDAYTLLVEAGLAPPAIPKSEKRAALLAHAVDGVVAGHALADLDTDAKRQTAYEALAATGAVMLTPSDEAITAAVTAHYYHDIYTAAPKAVTDAAEEALDDIAFKIGLNQTADLTLDALSLASIYFLAAIGLAITFGVMGVINMAHGEFIMMGAYTGYVVQQIVPGYTLSIALAIPAAFIVTFAAGVAMERLIIRWLYNRPLETLLATFGVSIALQQLAKNIFGTQARPLTSPAWLDGGLVINDIVGISYIRIAIFVLALIFLGVFLFIMKRTRVGLEVRAVTQNPRMASSMGINPDRINMLTFGLGSGIAGIAGVAIGLFAKVTSELGNDYIVQSFMTVVVGGVGNIWGTLAGAAMIGFLQKGIEWFNPSNTLAAQTFMIIFIIIFIQFRPRGIIALKGRAAGD